MKPPTQHKPSSFVQFLYRQSHSLGLLGQAEGLVEEVSLSLWLEDFLFVQIGRVSVGCLPTRLLGFVDDGKSSRSKIGEKLSSGPFIRLLSNVVSADMVVTGDQNKASFLVGALSDRDRFRLWRLA